MHVMAMRYVLSLAFLVFLKSEYDLEALGSRLHIAPSSFVMLEYFYWLYRVVQFCSLLLYHRSLTSVLESFLCI